MMIGPHLQNSVDNWNNHIGDWAATKLVDGVQRAADAAAKQSPVVVRHHTDDQEFVQSVDWRDHVPKARSFFATFVDGSFRKIAKHVDFVGEWNEYLANSQTDTEKAIRAAWAQACADVWKNDYRSQPDYKHIDLLLAAAAIGNDIPLSFAEVVRDYPFCVLDYHCYIPVDISKSSGHTSKSSLNDMINLALATNKNYSPAAGYHHHAARADFRDAGLYKMDNMPGIKNLTIPETKVATSPSWVMPGEWEFYSGRWEQMDLFFRQNGIKVRWYFGEWGVVWDASGNWSGWLDPQAGWAHENALDGSMEKLQITAKYWMDSVRKTVAWNQGYVISAAKFTLGGGKRWEHFNLDKNQWVSFADYIRDYMADLPPVDPPDPPNPDPDCTQPRVQYKRRYHVYPPNATNEQRQYVYEQADKNRATVGGSADDALYAAALTDVTGIFYGLSLQKEIDYVEFQKEHYPCSKIEFADLPDVTPIPPAKPAFGVDISHHQGQIDWNKMAAWRGTDGERVEFAYIKFTEGSGFKDPQAHRNWDEALRVGIVPGAYHYIKMESSKERQVKNFLDHFGNRVAQIAHVCDVEDAHREDDSLITFNEDTLLYWLAHIESAQSHRPEIYTAAWYWDDWVKRNIKWADAYKLWVSSLGTQTPTMPRANWDTWHIWQFIQGKGAEFGVETVAIDLNKAAASLGRIVISYE